MPVNLNMSDVPSDGDLPDGIYNFRIAAATIRKSRDNDNQNLNVKLEVIQPEEHVGRVVWENFSLTPQSLWKLKKFLEAVTNQPWEEDDMVLDEDDLVGLFVRGTTVLTVSRNDPNRKFPEIRDYWPDI